jgi:uncharacterized protein YbaP (TraB family)
MKLDCKMPNISEDKSIFAVGAGHLLGNKEWSVIEKGYC